MTIYQAIKLLLEKQVVILPTETVYGLAADATSSLAVQKVFQIKQRPYNKPLICHFHSLQHILKFVIVSDLAMLLIKHFMPGPLTLILPLITPSLISPIVNNHSLSLGVRIPQHPLTLEVIQALDLPIVISSANLANNLSSTHIAHIQQSLVHSQIPYIVKNLPNYPIIGIESTICLINNNNIIIIRPGAVTKEQLITFCKQIHYKFPEVSIQNSSYNTSYIQYTSVARMSKTHYKYHMSKSIRINATDKFKTSEFIIGFGPVAHQYQLNLSITQNLQEAAQNLFHYLYLANSDPNTESIAVTPIPKAELGEAINACLIKASNH